MNRRNFLTLPLKAAIVYAAGKLGIKPSDEQIPVGMPVEVGTVVFNRVSAKLEYWNGSTWEDFTSDLPTPDDWTQKDIDNTIAYWARQCLTTNADDACDYSIRIEYFA